MKDEMDPFEVGDICAKEITNKIKKLNKSARVNNTSQRIKKALQRLEQKQLKRHSVSLTVDSKAEDEPENNTETSVQKKGTNKNNERKKLADTSSNTSDVKKGLTNLHWLSSHYIMHNIRTCLLENNWTMMAHLLYTLSQQNNIPKFKLNSYLWQACHGNLLANPADECDAIYQEFAEQCLSQLKEDPFDIVGFMSKDP